MDARATGRGRSKAAAWWAQAWNSRGVIALVQGARPGITFDTGALIALERKRHNMRKVYAAAIAAGFAITVPAVSA
jgi:hypothetical protein